MEFEGANYWYRPNSIVEFSDNYDLIEQGYIKLQIDLMKQGFIK